MGLAHEQAMNTHLHWKENTRFLVKSVYLPWHLSSYCRHELPLAIQEL